MNGEDSGWFVTCGSGISDLEMIEITAPKLQVDLPELLQGGAGKKTMGMLEFNGLQKTRMMCLSRELGTRVPSAF
jgi:hypothetical protein